MKTFSLLAFLAAPAAVVFQLRFEIAISIAFAAGLIAIVVLDYGRRFRPLPVSSRPRCATPRRFVPPPLNIERNCLAA